MAVNNLNIGAEYDISISNWQADAVATATALTTYFASFGLVAYVRPLGAINTQKGVARFFVSWDRAATAKERKLQGFAFATAIASSSALAKIGEIIAGITGKTSLTAIFPSIVRAWRAQPPGLGFAKGASPSLSLVPVDAWHYKIRLNGALPAAASTNVSTVTITGMIDRISLALENLLDYGGVSRDLKWNFTKTVNFRGSGGNVPAVWSFDNYAVDSAKTIGGVAMQEGVNVEGNWAWGSWGPAPTGNRQNNMYSSIEGSTEQWSEFCMLVDDDFLSGGWYEVGNYQPVTTITGLDMTLGLQVVNEGAVEIADQTDVAYLSIDDAEIEFPG